METFHKWNNNKNQHRHRKSKLFLTVSILCFSFSTFALSLSLSLAALVPQYSQEIRVCSSLAFMFFSAHFLCMHFLELVPRYRSWRKNEKKNCTAQWRHAFAQHVFTVGLFHSFPECHYNYSRIKSKIWVCCLNSWELSRLKCCSSQENCIERYLFGYMLGKCATAVLRELF